jgi:hypothetical protein
MHNWIPATALFGALVSATASHAEPVEIYLLDMLDNTQAGYCIDIAKGKEEAANPDDGLQGHTCYSPSGALGFDQTFDKERLSDGILYMVNFDVCVQAPATEAGSLLELADCDGRDAQSFDFSAEGTITPASTPEMCMTVSEDTRSGRSSVNQIKVLSLELCSDDQAAFQTWGVRSSVD